MLPLTFGRTEVPLNYLLHRHGVSLMNVDAAKSVEARRSHEQLALGYARQINDMVQSDRGTQVPLVPLR